MLGEWSQNPIVKAAVVVAVVLVLLSFFFSPKRGGDENLAFGVRIGEAVGAAAAEEAAKILGDKGGEVVLVMLGWGEKEFIKSPSAIYERGFRTAAAKTPSLRVLEHYLIQLPHESPMTLGMLQKAREKFPSANLIVSFVNLLPLSNDDIASWLSSAPPKLIVVVQNPSLPPKTVQDMIQRGVVQAVFLFREGVRYPEKKPSDPHEIFQLFYQVIRP